eukprot:9671758-Prorocentrum_lima.AAC.1
MISRRSADQPIQPERVERADSEPCWIPEDEWRAAFPTEQRMRQSKTLCNQVGNWREARTPNKTQGH